MWGRSLELPLQARKNRFQQLIATRRGKFDGEKLPLPLDPWTFVRDCCYSQDEHAKHKGLPYIRPLVALGDDYLKIITDHVGTEQLLRIEKSRQLRVTWLMAALMLHHVLTQRGVRDGYVCRGFDSADIYLRDRFWFMYEQIPAEYAKPEARYVSGVIEVFHDGVAKSTVPTSQVMALAEGAAQVRQFTFTRLWGDEFAFQFDQDDFLTAAQPSLDGGGQAIITSSACGDGNAFYRLGHTAVNATPHTAEVDIAQGMTRWTRNGWTTLRVHYLADQHKRGEWARKARLNYSPAAWAQEQEIDFTITPGLPVWDCLTLKEVEQFYYPTLPVVSGMDYSFHANVCVTGQVRKREDGKYMLGIITTTATFGTYIEAFADAVNAERRTMYPHCVGFRDYGDYSANQRTSTGTIIEEMRRADLHLVTVPTGPGGVLKGNELVQHMISFGLLEIDPSNKALLQAIKSGYVFQPEKQDAKGLPVPTEEHPHADYAHALRYLVTNLFELREVPGGGYVVDIKNQYRGADEEKAAPAAPKPWRSVYADDKPTGQPRDAEPQDPWRGSAVTSKSPFIGDYSPQIHDAGGDDDVFRG